MMKASKHRRSRGCGGVGSRQKMERNKPKQTRKDEAAIIKQEFVYWGKRKGGFERQNGQRVAQTNPSSTLKGT